MKHQSPSLNVLLHCVVDVSVSWEFELAVFVVFEGEECSVWREEVSGPWWEVCHSLYR